MGFPAAFDLDLLRSFVVIAEEASFTKAADRVGRTQSAVSLQMQRLEGVVGHPLLERSKGGQVSLTAHGKELLPQARELLALNDQFMRTLKGKPMQGGVRLGLPDELAERYLPTILQRVMEASPGVEVEVTPGPSCQLSQRLKAGEFDLALLAEGMEPRQWPAEHIGQLQMVWLTSENAEPHKARPLPLAVSPQECPWRPAWAKECISRGITMRALERGGVPYRIVSSAGTTAAQLAAVQAGIAVASTAPLGPLPAGVRIVQPEEGLPELADCGFLMLKGQNPRQPMTDMLAEQIRAVFAAEPLGRATATAPSDPLAKSG